jgi:hypothetical protein
MLHDTSIRMRFVGTKEQVADIFTKGSFSESTWRDLVDLLQVRKTRGVSHLKPKGGNPGIATTHMQSEDTFSADAKAYVGLGEIQNNHKNNALLDPYMFNVEADAEPCSFAHAACCDSQAEATPALGCLALHSEHEFSEGPDFQGKPNSSPLPPSATTARQQRRQRLTSSRHAYIGTYV